MIVCLDKHIEWTFGHMTHQVTVETGGLLTYLFFNDSMLDKHIEWTYGHMTNQVVRVQR